MQSSGIQMYSRSSQTKFDAESRTKSYAALQEMPLIAMKLGPRPVESLQAMVRYGLNDIEIADYYAMSPSSVRRLRALFGIA